MVISTHLHFKLNIKLIDKRPDLFNSNKNWVQKVGIKIKRFILPRIKSKFSVHITKQCTTRFATEI